MKRLELQPTKENLIETLEEDLFGRNQDIAKFYEFLQTCNDFTSISIDGFWGCGKTFFVKQTELVINAYNPMSDLTEDERKKIRAKIPFENENEESIFCIYYDAWENDEDSNPIYSLVFNICKELDMKYDFGGNNNYLEMAASILELATGKDFSTICKLLKGENPVAAFSEEKNLQARIRNFFSEILAERGNRLIIFVDELDRCKPDFAVALLEKIKHYMSDERITFVFSINKHELQHTIRKYYGERLDACRYLDRFFDFQFPLPTLNNDVLINLIINGRSEYHNQLQESCRRIMEVFNFQLRDGMHFIETVRLITEGKLSEYAKGRIVPTGEKIVMLFYVIPVLVGLHMLDIEEYENFICGKGEKTFVDMYITGSAGDNLLGYLVDKHQETMVKNPSNIQSIKDKQFKECYNALFVNKYEDNYEQTVGICRFERSNKDLLLRMASMLSEYSRFQD